ncbi:hypothetical protein ACFY2M_43865 [Streptomyces sp. NPDC001276]
MRQLAKAIGMRSTASVTYHLANLERSGALIREGVSDLLNRAQMLGLQP